MTLDFAPSTGPVSPEPVILDGSALDFATLTRIARKTTHVAADAEALDRVRAARAVLMEAIDSGQPVYGSTTGVGAMKDVNWSPEDLEAFNMGLVRAHHFGTGEPFPSEVIRNAIAIRTNMALTGRVGCTTELVDAFLNLLDRDVVPVVRRTGSIGCADIGLMGQIGAVLTGPG
jgi:histidine ammonia-lyase